MVQITRIETTKKGRYALFCGAEFLFSVDEETFCEFALGVDKKLDDQQLYALQQRCELGRARRKALDLIAQRDHSRFELLQKLLRGFDEPTAQKAVAQIAEMGYIDDSAFAKSCRDSIFAARGLSRRAAEQYLKQRGIAAELIDQTLEGYGEGDYDRVVALIEAKYRDKLDSAKGVNSLFGALLRRGFDSSDIRDAIERLKPDYDEIRYD